MLFSCSRFFSLANLDFLSCLICSVSSFFAYCILCFRFVAFVLLVLLSFLSRAFFLLVFLCYSIVSYSFSSDLSVLSLSLVDFLASSLFYVRTSRCLPSPLSLSYCLLLSSRFLVVYSSYFWFLRPFAILCPFWSPLSLFSSVRPTYYIVCLFLFSSVFIAFSHLLLSRCFFTSSFCFFPSYLRHLSCSLLIASVFSIPSITSFSFTFAFVSYSVC